VSERQPLGLKLAGVDEVEVRIDKLVAGGDGFGRWQGVPLFVPRSAPGDLVRARIVERRPDFGRAEVEEVLEPGPGRREPPCPYFERCGGCDLQHLEDELQVELKAEAVLETLRRLGRIDTDALPSPPEVIAAEPWAYRLRTQLHVDPGVPPAGVSAGEEGAPGVGYFERGSHELVAVDRCPILVPEIEELLPALPRRLAEAHAAVAHAGAGHERLPRRIDLAAGGAGEVTTAPVVEGLPHGPVSAEVAGFELAFDARSFFQTHRGLLDRLVGVVLGPEAWTGERAYDLYCGVGLFALPLTRRYREVVGVEGDRIAIRYARNNARKNGRGGLRVEGMAVESWIAQEGNLPADADRVIVDPPRTGCHPQVVETLLTRPPKRLTYVSCHPATLARDLRKLTEIYKIQQLSLIDLFPQSGHMEAVVQLER
jgi:23S rRNA (uracil1939-C5)-methyltransferase